MSHVASVELFVTDLDALEVAAERLGLVLERGATTYHWYGSWQNDYHAQEAAVRNGHDPKSFGKCEHKLRRADGQGYEIGLVPRVDGGSGWELIYDNWGSGGRLIHDAAGVGLVGLKDEIAAEVSTRILQRKGYRVTRSKNAAGELQLTARR